MKKTIRIFLTILLFTKVGIGQWNPANVMYNFNTTNGVWAYNPANRFGLWYGTNLITNGTFDINISSWTEYFSVVLHYATDYNSVGRVNVLLDSATATSGVFVLQSLNTTAGVTYRLTYDYYIPSSNTTTNGIRGRLAAGQSLNNQTVINTWTTAVQTFVATASEISFRFFQTKDGSTAGITVNDKIYIDNVVLQVITYYPNYNAIKNKYNYNPIR